MMSMFMRMPFFTRQQIDEAQSRKYDKAPPSVEELFFAKTNIFNLSKKISEPEARTFELMKCWAHEKKISNFYPALEHSMPQLLGFLNDKFVQNIQKQKFDPIHTTLTARGRINNKYLLASDIEDISVPEQPSVYVEARPHIYPSDMGYTRRYMDRDGDGFRNTRERSSLENILYSNNYFFD